MRLGRSADGVVHAHRAVGCLAGIGQVLHLLVHLVVHAPMAAHVLVGAFHTDRRRVLVRLGIVAGAAVLQHGPVDQVVSGLSAAAALVAGMLAPPLVRAIGPIGGQHALARPGAIVERGQCLLASCAELLCLRQLFARAEFVEVLEFAGQIRELGHLALEHAELVQ